MYIYIYTGESWLLLKNYPEFEYFRDIVFYFKYLLGTNPENFPPVGPYNQKMAELKWQFKDGQYITVAYKMLLKCPAKGHRWYHLSSVITSELFVPLLLSFFWLY